MKLNLIKLSLIFIVIAVQSLALSLYFFVLHCLNLTQTLVKFLWFWCYFFIDKNFMTLTKPSGFQMFAHKTTLRNETSFTCWFLLNLSCFASWTGILLSGLRSTVCLFCVVIFCSISTSTPTGHKQPWQQATPSKGDWMLPLWLHTEPLVWLDRPMQLMNNPGRGVLPNKKCSCSTKLWLSPLSWDVETPAELVLLS